jgi:hypothetical protein
LAPDLTCGWVNTVLGGRKLRDVPNAELQQIVASLEAAASQSADDREMLITTLYSLAPDLKPGWINEVLGRRKRSDVTNAELQQIIDRLEAAAEIERAVDEKAAA